MPRTGEHVRAERDHDLLSALVAIEGGLRALPQVPSGPAADELLDALIREVAMARALLRPPSLPEVDPGRRGPRGTDVGALLRALAASERARGSEVEVRASDRLRVDVPEVRLHQVLRNLLDNARRHAPGAPVCLHADTDGATVVIDVRDAGPGVAHAQVAGVVRRGFRADTAGSGLGLSIVSQLVADAGGALIVDADAHGTNVSVHLPVLTHSGDQS